ncbi:glutamate synthase [Paludisphaera mucosa]|uniref:Glutamate synthase n=1 Tax=Paludisphaera mucosa TaxID=3030827 RepID=A0ABT6F628_9BACT|nr:glutamate synthase [Paludisphaera mucosa]MDG3003037.1 glutamate synthase [Paludisphaera mucosa]
MSLDRGGESAAADSPISVPELRDYHQINAEVVRRLNRGADRVRLEGPAGHRLLLAGLTGPWRAEIEIAGDAGPELAAGLDAPGLRIVCRGASADGAGGGLRQGVLLLLGPSGTALGYRQAGGLLIAADVVGPRAGLGMLGGAMVLRGSVGPLAGERQSGGRLFLPSSEVGPHSGWNSRGGWRFADEVDPIDHAGKRILKHALELLDRHASRPAAGA